MSMIPISTLIWSYQILYVLILKGHDCGSTEKREWEKKRREKESRDYREGKEVIIIIDYSSFNTHKQGFYTQLG